MARHLPIDAAARVLGVSRRTIERRVKAGTLTATYDGGRRLILVPDEVIDATGAALSDATATRHDRADSDARIAALEAELAAVRSERDYLRQHADYLALAVAQQAGRALPPGPDADPPPRPWWRFWRR